MQNCYGQSRYHCENMEARFRVSDLGYSEGKKVGWVTNFHINSECVAVLKGHNALLSRLILSPQLGGILLSASVDGNLRAWSPEGYTKIYSISAHTGAVTSLACDGSSILTGGSDGRIRLWDSKSGTLTQEVNGVSDAVYMVDFVPHGTVAAFRQEGKTMLSWFEK